MKTNKTSKTANGNSAPGLEKPAVSGPSQQSVRAIWALTGLAVLIAVYARLRLSGMALERDEGEYAYMGQLLLKGIPAYQDAYNMKLPGTNYMYAFLMALFGQTKTGIHVGLLLVNLATVAMLYFIGKKLASPPVGAIAAGSYALLSVLPGTFGFSAHATHFVVFFGLAGFLMLLEAFSRPRTWVGVAGAGIFFGLAFLMKQHALFWMLFGALLVGHLARKQHIGSKRTGACLLLYGACALLPYAWTVAAALASGNFERFWYWTVKYAGAYSGINTASQAIDLFVLNFNLVRRGAGLFWLLATLALGFLLSSRKALPNRWPVVLFACCSLLSIAPGFYFRNHYFILLLPAVSLLAALALDALWMRLTRAGIPFLRGVPTVLFAFMLFNGVVLHTGFLFRDPVETVCTNAFGRGNPFMESEEIARFIRENSNPDDRIAVIGSEPQIYFYSQRKSGTGLMYMYPLVENQSYSRQMQQQMIAEIEHSKPRFLLYVNSFYSWMAVPDANIPVIDWYERYCAGQYTPVGIADIQAPGRTVYLWNEQAQGYKPKGKYNISIYERKN